MDKKTLYFSVIVAVAMFFGVESLERARSIFVHLDKPFHGG